MHFSTCLSIYLSVYLSIYISIYPSMFMYLPIFLPLTHSLSCIQPNTQGALPLNPLPPLPLDHSSSLSFLFLLSLVCSPWSCRWIKCCSMCVAVLHGRGTGGTGSGKRAIRDSSISGIRRSFKFWRIHHLRNLNFGIRRGSVPVRLWRSSLLKTCMMTPVHTGQSDCKNNALRP